MIDKFLTWRATKGELDAIAYAKKTNPEFYAYMEDLLGE